MILEVQRMMNFWLIAFISKRLNCFMPTWWSRRIQQRKGRETKLQPSRQQPVYVPGCCLVSLPFRC